MIKECSFQALTCSNNYMLKDNKKTLEQGVKYVQS